MVTVATIITAGVIPLLVSVGATVATHAFQVKRDRVGLRDKHTWEQRSTLRRVVGSYHGRALEAAVDWDRRMQQLYKGSHKVMHPDEVCDKEQYFFHSVVFRFLTLLSLARRFEGQAFYIDARIAKDGELEFLRYLKSFMWVMTYSDITPNDGQPGRDHFLNDEFRPLLDLCRRGGEETREGKTPEPDIAPPFTYRDYWALVDTVASDGSDDSRTKTDARLVKKLLEFFAHLAPHEWVKAEDCPDLPRRRWQRLVYLHLLVLAFIATFGYSWQRRAARKSIPEAVKNLDGDALSADRFLEEGRATLGLKTWTMRVRRRRSLWPATRTPYGVVHAAIESELDSELLTWRERQLSAFDTAPDAPVFSCGFGADCPWAQSSARDVDIPTPRPEGDDDREPVATG